VPGRRFPWRFLKSPKTSPDSATELRHHYRIRKRAIRHFAEPLESRHVTFRGGYGVSHAPSPVSRSCRSPRGFPYVVYISDTNQLGDLTHPVRPDIVTGRPLVNPLYDRKCPNGAGCQPYISPAAFPRPGLGLPGNSISRFRSLSGSAKAALEPPDFRGGAQQWRRRRFHG
jgi:hypothetical protein